MTVLHDDTNGLLHAERVFLERGVAVDGAVEGEAQAIIRGRGGSTSIWLSIFSTPSMCFTAFSASDLSEGRTTCPNRGYSQSVGCEKLFDRERHREPVRAGTDCELACAEL